MITSLAAVWTAACGAATDLKSHKIYNKLTIPAAAAGFAVNLALGGPRGLGNSFLGLLLGGFMMVFWLLGMLKAGDVKLYMAVGAIAGWKFCGYTILYSILAGGLVAVILMAIRKNGRESLKRLRIYMVNLIYTRKFETYRPSGQSGYFSFGCCILAGTLAAFWKLNLQACMGTFY